MERGDEGEEGWERIEECMRERQAGQTLKACVYYPSLPYFCFVLFLLFFSFFFLFYLQNSILLCCIFLRDGKVEEPHFFYLLYIVLNHKRGKKKTKKKIKMKKLHTIDNQKPSTLGLRKVDVDDEDFLLSCRSRSSKERVEEQARGGRDTGTTGGLVGETERWVLDGGEGEKLSLGAGVMIPLRLGDLDICFPATAAGSCRGNRQEYFMS